MPWNISKLSNTGDLQFAYFYAPDAKTLENIEYMLKPSKMVLQFQNILSLLSCSYRRKWAGIMIT